MLIVCIMSRCVCHKGGLCISPCSGAASPPWLGCAMDVAVGWECPLPAQAQVEPPCQALLIETRLPMHPHQTICTLLLSVALCSHGLWLQAPDKELLQSPLISTWRTQHSLCKSPLKADLQWRREPSTAQPQPGKVKNEVAEVAAKKILSHPANRGPGKFRE